MNHSSATAQQRLYRIVEEGMCTGCGLCQSVAGVDSVRVEKVTSGYQRPRVVGPLSHATVDQIYDVCPGIRVQGLAPRLIASDTRQDSLWGPYRQIVRGWAADPEVRFEGSTGGVLTALAGFLLASGRVAFVLHVKASQRHPTFGEPQLSFSQADVIEAAGSRYGPAAPLLDIRAVLDRGEPFAFIGKPCDITALNNYGRQDPRVDELVRYRLAPVCGGYRSPAATDQFIASLGIEPDELRSLRYRGRGCPGPVRAETHSGRVVEKRYADYWGEDETAWSLPFRCKVCPDGIGEGADIAASDTWPNDTIDPATEQLDPGTNALIVRTLAGQELLQAAVHAQALALGDEIGPRDLDSYQPHQVKKKQAALARLQGMEDEGRLGIRHQGLRLEALAAQQPESHFQRQRAGTRQRIRDGKASESAPE
ncbi:Coenzyme F420 hydrogenase/dehydrogenase, beta subunit C-terminal domain [Marinobacterium rhizophilum]|uniref:Coenzyme F420 hydrogenase/dehydrogenase, beta subunit C-terminal domain n=1 Tax=Marinobacterium rhizophilum TaxID=420402 RepID=A0ABY5HLN9_9GAMM|nr:Coenzyme F420 hydrogenase/dehydrogenase, beta subunit C-terminal domain [Marinobacterium rhizophilum]UTW13044.1 Coenzyme F420 hydrogenase/dehydrogenase, beta subunit C-terminal domain [Marinobacterium rhizophilum]